MKLRHIAFLIAAGCLRPTVFGSLTGMVVEQARFNRQRRTLLQHLGATQERLHTHLMDIGRQTQSPEAEMMPSFRAINDARQSIDANLRTETS